MMMKGDVAGHDHTGVFLFGICHHGLDDAGTVDGVHLHLQALVPVIGFRELDQLRNGHLADVVQRCHSPNVFHEIRIKSELPGYMSAACFAFLHAKVSA